jgi:hypothetical protein
LESDDHEILKTDDIAELYCEPDERNFFQKLFHPIKRAFGGKALAIDAQTWVY